MYAVQLRSKFAIAIVIIIFVAGILGSPATAYGQGKKGKKSSKQICVTFDELPVAISFGDVDRSAITYLILETLKKHKVKAAGFVVGNQIEDSFDILGEWLNNGHILGNMTYSNQDLHELPNIQ